MLHVSLKACAITGVKHIETRLACVAVHLGFWKNCTSVQLFLDYFYFIFSYFLPEEGFFKQPILTYQLNK